MRPGGALLAKPLSRQAAPLQRSRTIEKQKAGGHARRPGASKERLNLDSRIQSNPRVRGEHLVQRRPTCFVHGLKSVKVDSHDFR